MTKKAFQSFAKQGPDGIIVVSEDGLFDDDHEYVKWWPEMFGEHYDLVTVHAATPGAPKKAAKVEQATAAPGETRDAVKPKK